MRLAPLTLKLPFPRREPIRSAASDSLVASGLFLRHAVDADLPFLQALFASFRADEMQYLPWPQPQKDAFLNEQFRLQHHHFVSYFPGADFWIVEQLHRSGHNAPIGRFYIDRSNPLWHIIDIGLLPDACGRGSGSALLQWAQAGAISADAAGIDLHVVVVNARAQKLYRSLGFRMDGTPEGYHQRMTWRARA